ncbi:MAG: hypothetical protein KAR76_02400 [Methanosarcinales archaeon]|nr:hypothetical protein [Methanosarcinales archaeon]
MNDMEKAEEQSQTFHQNSGEIIRMALHIESNLDFFIANYFCSPQNHKTFLLGDLILSQNFGFGRKINIFRGICKHEDIESERMKKITDAIEFVQKIRNRVAHNESFVSNREEGIKLQKRKSVTWKKDELKLTDELIKEIDEKRLFAIQGITKIHLELSDPSRETNHEW